MLFVVPPWTTELPGGRGRASPGAPGARRVYVLKNFESPVPVRIRDPASGRRRRRHSPHRCRRCRPCRSRRCFRDLRRRYRMAFNLITGLFSGAV